MENPKPPEDTTNMTEDDNPVQQQQQNSSDLKYLESVSKDAEALYNSAIFELHFLKAEGDYLQLDNFQARPSDKAINILDKLPVTEDSDDKIVELLASDEKKVQNEEANTRQKSLESSTGEKPIGRLTRAQSKEESEKQNATPPPQHKTVSRGQAARDAMSLKRADASQRLRNGSASVSSVEKVLMTKNFTESQRNAYVERVVNQLKSQGLWSGDRLPKLVDPRQAKTNWDYVMDEMQWLATDFAQERKWKIAAARKIARAVRQYHRAKEEKKKKEEREAYLKKRRLAAKIARMVHTFWDGINRVVQYKHESLMEEKRQKILDIQLNFIVGQTERYSGYLTKQLQANNEEESKSADAPPTSTAKDGDKESSEVPPISSSTQGEAAPKEDESSEKEKVAEAGEKDVEAKAEEEKESKESSNVAEEDAAQQITVRRSSRKRNAASTDSSSATNTAACEKPPKIAKTEESGTPGNDEEFDPEAEGNVSDDEATMQQEEDQQDEKEDHKEEIKELEEDNDLSIEELMRKYGYEVPSKDDSAAADENAPPAEEGSSKSEEAGEQDEKDEGKKEEDEGDDEALKFLVDDDDDADADKNKEVAESGDFDEASKQARNIQPTGHTLATTQVKTPIPKLLRGELREYQHIGLNWLVTLYNERLNGILADEMGLGKTIQTIALLAHLACEKGVWGPHLIVVPTSVMLNWEMEFKKWCPGFKILTYYGNQKERKMKRTGWSKSNAFHVCITSYKLVVQDHAAFRRRKWRYLILDEAHNIKNFKSQRWQALLNFNSQRRLLLTGTPLQNNLMELWSLMHFLMPHLFQSRNDFKDWFANPLDGMVGGEAEYNEGIIRRLHKVLRPFLLRRVKKEVEKQMPNKYEHVVRCHLSKRQRFLYEDFMSRAATKDTLAKGDLLSVMNVLMQLRKVCNHPNLFEPRPIVTSFTTRALEYQPPSLVASCLVERDPLAQAINLTDLNLHLPALCGFTTHQVDSIRQLRADDRQLIELSPAQFPTESKTNKISTSMRKTIMDKLAKRSMASYHERVEKVKKSLSASIDRQFNSRSQQSSSSQQLMNVASVASLERIKGNKRLDAESYSKWLGRMQQARKAENRVRTARINERRCDVSNQAVSSNLIKLLQSIYLCKREDDYVNNRYAELASVVINKLYKEMREMQTLDKVDIVIPRVESPSMLYHQQHPPQWETYQLKNKKDFLVDYFKPCKLMMSKKLLFPETQLIQYDCGKLQILNVLLRRFQEGKHRVLIFTQMTKVLDILEVFLNYHGYRYLRLDGSTHIEERMIRMERFNNDKRIFCFILSTRSGGIGVNLTGADTVVFYDSDWNPTMDAQAQDRCHRIGQTRDVHIYRLISERTIEENILRKANQKRMLNNLAIEGGHFTTSFFTKQGIKDIFAEPSGLENMDEDQQKLEQKIQDKQNQQKQQEEASSASSSAAAEAADTKKDEKEFGEALLRSEDMEDQCAAEMVEKEQIAEREEFGDNPNINNSNQEGVTRAEEKIRAVYEQLSSLQRYAVDYIERNANISFDDQLQMAQEDLEKAKKTWEVNHLLSLKEEEERRLEEEEDDIFYVCEEGVNQHFYEVHTGEEMPTWYPPTPPKNDEDYYVDDAAMFLYKSTPMNVCDLPPVIPLQHKTPEMLIPMRRIMRGDVAFAGCLFKHSHAPPATRGRNKDKLGKQIRGSQAAAAAGSNASVGKNSKNAQQSSSSVHLISAIRNEQGGGKEGVDYMKTDRNNEWSINEDYTIAHYVERMLETSGMTPQASAQLPARLIDWGIVAGVVRATSNRYRSADDCERRYSHIQMMREEKANQASNAYGMTDNKSNLLAPPNLPPPKKKQKTLQKLMGQKNKMAIAPPSGSNDSSGTKRMFADDGNKQYTTNLVNWMGACKLAVEKRGTTQVEAQDQLNIIALTSTPTPVVPSVSSSVSSSSKLPQQFSLNSKQLSMLQDLGVDYDKPTTPMQFSIGPHRTSNKQQRQQQTKRTSDQPSTSQVVNVPSHHSHQQISGFVMTTNASQQQIAIPITGSGGAAGVVVPQGFARRLVSHQGGKSVTTTVTGHNQHKVQQAKQAVSALTFRTMGNSISQLQLQQQQQVGSSQQQQQPIAVSFAQQQQVVTITSTATNAQQQRGNVYTARGNLQKITGSLQQVRQQKALQHQQALQQVKQQQVKVKQVRVSQAAVHQLQGSNVIQAAQQAKAVMGGKAVQIGKPQQTNRYELYMKSNAGNRAGTQFKPFTHQRAQQVGGTSSVVQQQASVEEQLTATSDAATPQQLVEAATLAAGGKQKQRHVLSRKSNKSNRNIAQYIISFDKPMTQKSSVKIKGGGEATGAGGAARRASKSGEKVQIAPLQGQQQAQVRSLVAHQSGGNQPQGGSKPILVTSHTLPSTSLPVTAVTLNVSSASQQKPMIVANNQNYVIQQPYFKQRQQSTQQQTRQVIAAKQGKAVYATAQQLIAATGGRGGEQQVKAIQHSSAGNAQVIHAQLTTGAQQQQQQRIVQQQQAQQRRTAMTSQQQQHKNMAPHTVTVTKLMTATTTGAVLSQVTYPTGAPAGSITFPASGKTYQVQQNPVTSRTTINTPKTYQIQPQQLSGRSSQQQQIQIATNQLNQAQQLINVSAPIHQRQQDQTERDNN